VFLLQGDEAHAAYFLKKQGVNRLRLLKAIAHVDPAGAPDARSTEGEEAGPKDPLAAYAVELVEKARRGQNEPRVGPRPRNDAATPGPWKVLSPFGRR